MKFIYTLSLIILCYLTTSPAMAIHECDQIMGSCLPHIDEIVLPAEVPQEVVAPAPAPEVELEEPVNPWNPPPDVYDPTEQDELNYTDLEEGSLN